MNQDAIEIKVKVSNDEQKYTKKHLHYGPLTISRDSPELIALVEDTLKEFKGMVDDVCVNFNLVWH